MASCHSSWAFVLISQASEDWQWRNYREAQFCRACHLTPDWHSVNINGRSPKLIPTVNPAVTGYHFLSLWERDFFSNLSLTGIVSSHLFLLTTHGFWASWTLNYREWYHLPLLRLKSDPLSQWRKSSNAQNSYGYLGAQGSGSMSKNRLAVPTLGNSRNHRVKPGMLTVAYNSSQSRLSSTT